MSVDPENHLPTGWIKASDPQSGRMYYANTSTGETRWDLPPPSAAVAIVDPLQETMIFTNTYEHTRRGAVQDAQALVAALLLYNKDSKARTSVGDVDDQKSNMSIQVELQSLSAGQLADLVHLGNAHNETNSDALLVAPLTSPSSSYTPINPHRFTPTQERAPAEPGRLVTRLQSLREKLNNI